MSGTIDADEIEAKANKLDELTLRRNGILYGWMEGGVELTPAEWERVRVLGAEMDDLRNQVHEAVMTLAKRS